MSYKDFKDGMDGKMPQHFADPSDYDRGATYGGHSWSTYDSKVGASAGGGGIFLLGILAYFFQTILIVVKTIIFGISTILFISIGLLIPYFIRRIILLFESRNTFLSKQAFWLATTSFTGGCSAFALHVAMRYERLSNFTFTPFPFIEGSFAPISFIPECTVSVSIGTALGLTIGLLLIPISKLIKRPQNLFVFIAYHFVTIAILGLILLTAEYINHKTHLTEFETQQYALLHEIGQEAVTLTTLTDKMIPDVLVSLNSEKNRQNLLKAISSPSFKKYNNTYHVLRIDKTNIFSDQAEGNYLTIICNENSYVFADEADNNPPISQILRKGYQPSHFVMNNEKSYWPMTDYSTQRVGNVGLYGFQSTIPGFMSTVATEMKQLNSKVITVQFQRKKFLDVRNKLTKLQAEFGYNYTNWALLRKIAMPLKASTVDYQSLDVTDYTL